MGLAVMVVIGSVLILHERINALLTGEEQSVITQEPPLTTADAMEQPPMGLSASKREKVAPVTMHNDSVAITNQRDGLNTAKEETATERVPARSASGSSPSPQASAELPPIVVNHETPAGTAIPSVSEKELAKEEDAQASAELKLTGISPSPLIGSNEVQRIILHGSGFVDGSSVALSRGDRVELLPTQKTLFLDSGQIAIEVNTGIKPATWAVLVSTPDKRLSNAVQFQIVVPPNTGNQSTVVVTENAEASSPPTSNKTLPDDPEKWKVQGYDWLAKQPKQNFTLQLLASASMETIGYFAGQEGLAGPLASFVVDKDGETLHVLTQGSYTNRVEAEQAAKSLPKGISPWIRTLGSVQQEMKSEAQAVTNTEVSLPHAHSGVKDIAWIWSQDPNHYAIQLAAAENEQSIEVAMRDITLPKELAVVHTLREGKPWYALIYGSFASKASARVAIEGLTERLQRLGPWPRSFASLQEEISRSTPTQ